MLLQALEAAKPLQQRRSLAGQAQHKHGLHNGKDGAATDVVARFKRFACFESSSDAERNAVSEVHFRVIEEDGGPVIDDVVAGELFWAATKSLFSGAAILIVITGMGLTNGPLALWALPAIVLTGLAFAALGLIWRVGRDSCEILEKLR